MRDVASLVFRRPRDEDLPRAAAVFGAEEEALRGRVTMGVDEMRDWWRLFELEESWLVEDGEEPVAVGALSARGGDFNLWVGVHPEYTGRGISSELISRAERSVRGRGGNQLKAGMLAENERARLLLEQLGFHEVRRFYRMQIDFDGAPPSPKPVEGVRIATFRPEDARSFHSTLNEAFTEDWGFVAMPFDEWKEFRLKADDADTSLWFLAWDGAEVAGVIRCDAKKFGGGFVGALGVRKPWRGQGIGTALLQHALGEYYCRGMAHVSLGVDAENQSGATRLYERAGMRVVSEDVVFEKALT
ncbi:MAG: GNAT family N-acetyltransferase [Actinobacteria bacterium]|nr:MAG: GNAT family N-acetyltransferase [Actinomycetota bacterium]